MTRFSAGLAILALCIAIAGPASAESARSSIEAAVANFAKAYNSGDAAAVAAHYTEDAAILPPDADRVDGREGIQKFWQGAMDGGLSGLTLKAVEIEDNGDVAYEVGTFSLKAPREGGTPVDVSGKYLVVWKKGPDGNWRLHRDIWNTAPAPGQ